MTSLKRIILFVLAFFLLAGCAANKPAVPPGKGDEGLEPIPHSQELPPGAQRLAAEMKVHFLDVGQGDSILIQFPDGRNMLVDAGGNDDASTVVNYLKKTGVKRLDYLIGTHPHEDHIGSLDTVINSFQIGEVFMPKVTHTTRTFQDVLEAIDRKGLQINPARAGVTIMEDGMLAARILAPCGEKYDELNDYSAVIMLTCGEVSFLLTGDAEALSEKEILASGASIKADVLKVGHHGSSSSTSAAFLKAVGPRYAVISVGAENDYGHPHQATLDRLKKQNVEVIRTDKQGTIIFTTDGKELSFTTDN
ncbi:MAG TPA: ComEC/Rec2 family competence protein [Bacillota bacterium]|jgi:beta-lactamase superfamily II metal-dependent hydrolase|nr:ComEC/Rec2 family competence protein [Bacillota bacterium]